MPPCSPAVTRSRRPGRLLIQSRMPGVRKKKRPSYSIIPLVRGVRKKPTSFSRAKGAPGAAYERAKSGERTRLACRRRSLAVANFSWEGGRADDIDRKERLFRRDVETNTRDACATQSQNR